MPDGAGYVFQGNDLVVPDGPVYGLGGGAAGGLDGNPADGEAFYRGLPADLIRGAFPGSALVEFPPVDGSALLICSLEETPLPAGWRRVSVREILPLSPRGILNGGGDVGRLFRAYHVLQWRRDSAFCGTCGSPNGEAPDELARLCPVCGRREYPRISPAIIVLITNDQGEALLAHNKKFTPGVYSLIAGFNEAGENLETTLRREVREEVGIEVDRIRYEASQPWPFPNSLMIGFTARYARGELRPDGVEIEDARWFRRDALPKLPGQGSVSRYLINRWTEKIPEELRDERDGEDHAG